MTWQTTNGIEIKTLEANTIWLTSPVGDLISISMTDFLDMVFYVLTNTDLEKDDLRVKFLQVMREMVPRLSDNNQPRLAYKEHWSLHPPNWRRVGVRIR